MAQSGYTPIQLYYSSTTTNVPLAANLAYGELAINITDGKLFYKDNANAIQVIGWKVVPATAGGTGQTSYAVGDLIYANTTTTLAKLPDVATGNALISGGVSTAPSWGKIGLTTHVSGTLPVSNGGTGLTAVTAGYIPFGNSATALNTDGGLFWDNTNKRLGIGTASPALEVDISFANAGDGLRVRNTQNSGFADVRVGNDAQANLGFLRVGGSTYGGIYQNALGIATGGGYNIVIAPQSVSTMVFDPSANATLTSGNLVIGTSGKGINFTANTPAAGMTSQLLNWYEEGTWTPNQGAGLTVVGAFSSTGLYTRIGRQVTVTGRVTGATSINTSGSGIVCTNLPFTVGTNSNSVGVMTNTATNNTNVYVNPGTATMYSSMASGVSGSLYFTVTYSV
jgi:hypothetical protein